MELESNQQVALRIGLLIIGCTILLTASFVGFFTALTGRISGYESRIAWYVVAVATLFVGTIVLLELNGTDGKTIIVSAAVTGAISFVLIFFSIEGLIFAVTHPGEMLLSQLIVYFFAAALVATGLGYWGLRHWREFTEQSPGSI